MPRSRSRSRSRSRDKYDRDRDRRRSRSRSRSRDRDRRDRRDKYRSDRDRDRSSRRSRSPPPRRRSRSPRRRSRSRDRLDSKRRSRSPPTEEVEMTVFQPISNEITEEDFADKDEDEKKMMELMGFGTFDSTKGKRVVGNDHYAANIVKKRRYRQYMNRRGGFNRPLDFIA